MTTERAILTALSRAHPYLLPEPTLLVDVNCILSAPVSYTDLRRKLQALEARRLIISLAPDTALGETAMRYRITDLGRVEVP